MKNALKDADFYALGVDLRQNLFESLVIGKPQRIDDKYSNNSCGSLNVLQPSQVLWQGNTTWVELPLRNKSKLNVGGEISVRIPIERPRKWMCNPKS